MERTTTVPSDVGWQEHWYPKGLSLYPYQEDGVRFIVESKSALLADEPGLGKTVQAIVAVNSIPDAKDVLVVCPASMKLTWAREYKTWGTRGLTIGVVHGVRKSNWVRSNVVIINYDILHAHRDQLGRLWDVVIGDEIHYIKSAKSRRSKCFSSLRAKLRIGLSGTPMPNRPAELHPVISWVRPGLLPSWWEYTRIFCNRRKKYVGRGRYVNDVSGSSNLPRLRELVSKCMLRRTKQDVLKDLPAKVHRVVTIDSSDSAVADLVDREMEAYRATITAQARIHALRRSETEAFDEQAGQIEAQRVEGLAELAKLRQATGLAKVPFVRSYLGDVLEEEQKVIMFVHHRSVGDAVLGICRDLKVKAVAVRGGMTSVQRQLSVDQFQGDDSVRVIVGNIVAAGTGLTLTAARRVVFVELDWVPSNLKQASDRPHRIGQEDSVLVDYLVFDRSIDSRMIRSLIRKQKKIDRVIA